MRQMSVEAKHFGSIALYHLLRVDDRLDRGAAMKRVELFYKPNAPGNTKHYKAKRLAPLHRDWRTKSVFWDVMGYRLDHSPAPGLRKKWRRNP